MSASPGVRCSHVTEVAAPTAAGPAETIDHVMPRSRGGQHDWDNVVAACARCNHSKGDRLITELGWRLHSQPAPPRGQAWRVLGHRTPDPRWSDWLDLPAAA